MNDCYARCKPCGCLIRNRQGDSRNTGTPTTLVQQTEHDKTSYKIGKGGQAKAMRLIHEKCPKQIVHIGRSYITARVPSTFVQEREKEMGIMPSQHAATPEP